MMRTAPGRSTLDVGRPLTRRPASKKARRHGAPHGSAGSGRLKRTRGRRSRCRWAFIAVLSLAVAAVTISEAMQYRQARVWATELFLLEEIRVTGAARFSADEILSVVDLTRGETDMADVDASRVRADIAVAFPDFRSVTVTRDVPAGTLVIDVVERTPLARVVTGGVVHIVDEHGWVLTRPFAGADDPLAASPADVLPTISVTGAESDVGMFDGPEMFRALRLMAAYEAVVARRQGGVAHVRIESVDAHDPDRIAVGMVDGSGGRRAAILAERTMAAGLRNVLLVADRRQEHSAHDFGNDFDVVLSSGAQDDTARQASPGVEGVAPTELIDARFESTVYVKTIPGGQDG